LQHRVPNCNPSGERRPGRPRTLSRGEASQRALDLFARRGFDATTMEELAAELGVGRRTLFRYFPSKNDLVWGDFDRVLDRLRSQLAAAPPDEPILDAVTHAVVRSNRYPADELPELRIRMTLITTVPALQAHSMVRYAEWRAVIAEFAAARLGQRPDDLMPLTLGYAALGTSIAAFVRWVGNPDDDLEQNLLAGYARLARGFDDLGR
jgi:TetR/AcrR family transcriptional regulator, regulator of mycofactocin system